MVEKNLLRAAPLLPVLLVLPLLIFLGGLSAQTATPFETLNIGLRCVANTNRNVFHDFWAPGRGVDAFIGTPFYYGTVQAGFHTFPFYGRKTDISDFQTVFVYLKWGKRWSLLNELCWFGLVGVGGNIMIFETEWRYSRYESELGMSLDSGVSYTVHGNMAINFSGSYNIIFTSKQIRLMFLSAGVSYSLSTPGWLKAFLE
ncbi:MAG: hypothetical protein JSU77_12310 [Fidelibacterota bacterium]|nr:MAG: hypothetical protein JSU77_12310 [Candidatus Neomarinimicrobiota bacterium]